LRKNFYYFSKAGLGLGALVPPAGSICEQIQMLGIRLLKRLGFLWVVTKLPSESPVLFSSLLSG
jgi:hypothetical protein